MSAINTIKNEKGVVLVVALLITAIMFIMAFALAYNLQSYLRVIASVREKTQAYYTNYAGLESMRDNLWFNDCIPPNWCGRLGVATNIADTRYQDITAAISGMSEVVFGGAAYKLYIRDNEDGDADYTTDNDQIILISVVGQGGSGASSSSTIEAMLIYSESTCYRQGGQCPSKNNAITDSSGTNDVNIRQNI